MSRQVQLENLQEPPQQLGHLKSLLAGGLPRVFTDKPLIGKRRLLFPIQSGSGCFASPSTIINTADIKRAQIQEPKQLV